MDLDEDFNRMRWASRRGLLELDLLLGPFVEACYRKLDASAKDDYQRLMTHDDQDILNWILGREPVSDASLAAIAAAICAHNAAKLR